MTLDCPRGMQMPHKPTDFTRGMVAGLYLCGTTQDKIAERLGISDESLRKYYRKELDENKQDINSEMVGILVRSARSGNLKALIFYLRTIAGLYEARPPQDIQNVQETPFGKNALEHEKPITE